MPKRVDRNHWEICAALRELGWAVFSTASVGNGFPDLVAARRGVLKLIEVKDGTKPASARKLTDDEAIYHAMMAAAGCPVVIVESLEDVAKL